MKKGKKVSSNELHRYYMNRYYLNEKRRKRDKCRVVVILSGVFILVLFIIQIVLG